MFPLVYRGGSRSRDKWRVILFASKVCLDTFVYSIDVMFLHLFNHDKIFGRMSSLVFKQDGCVIEITLKTMHKDKGIDSFVRKNAS
jgi:hypothetical protein